MPRKTYKRETAIMLLIFLGGMFIWGAGWNNGLAIESGKFLTLPVFTFVCGAFGLEGVRQWKEANVV